MEWYVPRSRFTERTSVVVNRSRYGSKYIIPEFYFIAKNSTTQLCIVWTATYPRSSTNFAIRSFGNPVIYIGSLKKFIRFTTYQKNLLFDKAVLFYDCTEYRNVYTCCMTVPVHAKRNSLYGTRRWWRRAGM